MKRQTRSAAHITTTSKQSGGEYREHLVEVRRAIGGFVVVTRHYSASDAELQKRREGGEVVRK